MNCRSRLLSAVVLLVSAMTMLLSGAAVAQVAKEGHSTLDGMAFAHPSLIVNESLEPIGNVQSLIGSDVANGWESFRQSANGEWNALVDKRTGHIDIAEGAGIPWVPGRGNNLGLRDVAAVLNARGTLDMASLDTITRHFLPPVASPLRANPGSLGPNRGPSGRPA